ncbi:MAG TPA: M23 family metallopeptidase [Sulfurimonas sp.]|uniref:M23 family metallopeptidase n=1 Tax=Sulfurimonas sp. TaxID=2022749 RepID=UPI002C7DFEA2|nr:M23 family metallopeptidase [Sulfurimonas sp.]HUH42139.1 M23 family metallopeptidase [Sulfurimonas sp.]
MRRRENGSLYGLLFILAVIVGGSLYIYNSLMFERETPTISLKSDGYWNLKDPLKLSIQDLSGIKSYKVTLKSSSEDTILYHEQFMEAKGPIEIKIESPKSAYTMKDKEIKIVVEALDASKWNFFQGNFAQVEYTLKIDKKRPLVNIVANSYKISKGGSALVIFKIEDENLKNFYIETNFDKKFKAQPFYKDGYYIALIAWPITEANFKATVVAEDYANNSTQVYVPLYLREKSYKVSNIKLTDNFLHGKIAELAEEFEETQGVSDSIEQFKLINETVRLKNEKLIHEITSKVPQNMIQDFHINSMYPLKNGAVVAHYGDHRIYSYNDKDISESYHMGLDLASNAQAEIRPQNGGEVVFADYNGLYGNMPIISHGLGLYTLYGHCSSIAVNNGDMIADASHLANTGKSGYAMGDHLHFGVLVQGIEVHPAEWMDSDWMRLNISDVIKSSKDIIDKKI